MSQPPYPPQDPWPGPPAGSPPPPPPPPPGYPQQPSTGATSTAAYGEGAPPPPPPQAPWAQQPGQPYGQQQGQPYGQQQGQPYGQPGQPYGQPGQPYGQPGAPWAPPGGTSSNRTPLYIALAVGGALVLALVLFLTLRGGDSGIPDPTREPTGLGTDAVFDEMAQDCHHGDMQACDDLFFQSPSGSAYEDYGDTCAGRQESGGLCTLAFPED